MTEEARLVNEIVTQSNWVYWVVVVGVLVILAVFGIVYTILVRNVFRRQLAVLAEATNERARTLYLEHLPVINERIDREVERLEEHMAERTEEHNKDILFLLQENERLERLLAGRVSKESVETLKLTKEEETERALKVLLARIRRENL